MADPLADPRSRAWHAWGETPLALLLAAATLLAALEIHPAGEAHDALAGGSARGVQGVFFPGAAHPRQGPHVEDGTTSAQRPFCPACFNRLQTRGARFVAVAAAAPPAPDGVRPPAPSAVVPVARSERPRGARAPPSR